MTDMTAFKKEAEKQFRSAGIALTDAQMQKMACYYDFMEAENRKYNLSAIAGVEDAVKKHFLDSAEGAALLPEGSTVIDVGSGAGFPLVPLKILREDIHAYALEASQKKCGFIETGSQRAGIEINVINERAEDTGRGEWREKLDVCVSRAVTRLPQLLELCAPLIRHGGLLMAYKGAAENIHDAENAMDILKMKLCKTVETKAFKGDRVIYVFEKTGVLPEKYPRKYAQISKRPL